MNTFKTYLQEARKENNPVLKNVVFGNTSADMDSVVGSMLMSWFYANQTGIKYTPVVYCTRHELTFRFEILGHLSTFGIDEAFLKENVVFKDDFQGQEAEVFADVESVGLIDFNKLTKELSCIKDKVHYIVDHHADHGLYLDTVKDKKITICGSATTLIVQKILTESDLFQTSSAEDTSELALFACAPLSLDSFHFQSDFKVHKWIDLDQQMFEQLCTYYS
jgi:inorganic pyrophosphatase/exopolyphosphatase